MAADDTSYRELIDEGRRIYAPTRIGRPGRGRMYWPLYGLAQALRLRWHVSVSGAEHVGQGPGILVGNHLSMLDPVMTGITSRWRLAFFTKVEVYEQLGGAFFRITGQIPLRRGDERATDWALRMSEQVVREGRKLCVYPEATRSPDRRSLHRLHMRVLVPILRANPGVPVHAMTVAYGTPRLGRIPVNLRFSPALKLDPETMSARDLTAVVRDALLETGGMPYVDAYGRSVKAAQ